MDVTYQLTFLGFFGFATFFCAWGSLTNYDFLRKNNKAEESYFDLNYMDVEDIWYHGLYGSQSDLTRGLRLEVRADGELITNGTVDAMEDVEQIQSLVVVGADVEDADTLLEEVLDGLPEESSDSEAD